VRELRAIDVCCGAGGWIVAGRGLPIRFVAAIDWAWDCCITTKYNHPEVPVVQADVTKLDWRRLSGKVDVVLGAIPCEEISLARSGIELPESELAKWHGLLDAVLDGIRSVKPRWWAVENVPQMRRHLQPLTPYVILDSALCSGQRRPRIFVGEFPLPKQSPRTARTLAEYLRPGPYILHERARRCRAVSQGRWYPRGVKRVLSPDRISPTITNFGSRHSRGYLVSLPDSRERMLQFTEAAELQGFPSDYVFVASQSRAWKMVAQAVQIDLAREIRKAIVADAQRSHSPARPELHPRVAERVSRCDSI